MSAPDDGGDAFPSSCRTYDDDGVFVCNEPLPGMTMRDYFAAKVLSAITSNPDPRTCPSAQPFRKWQMQMAIEDARTCYAYADAMIAERSKPIS